MSSAWTRSPVRRPSPARWTCYECGYITPKETGGIGIRFGDAETMVKLVEMIGNREGIGDQLAEGSYRFAEKYGHPEYSMSVKKQEMPAYDPRGIQAIGLQFATSNRGGCHVRGYTISPEVLGVPFKVDQHTTEGKPNLVIIFQNLTAALDSTGSCLFTTFGIGADELAALLSSVTGVDLLHGGLHESRRSHLEPGAALQPEGGPDDERRYPAHAAPQ